MGDRCVTLVIEDEKLPDLDFEGVVERSLDDAGREGELLRPGTGRKAEDDEEEDEALSNPALARCDELEAAGASLRDLL